MLVRVDLDKIRRLVRESRLRVVERSDSKMDRLGPDDVVKSNVRKHLLASQFHVSQLNRLEASS